MARRLLQNARTQDGWYYLLAARVAEKRREYKEAYKNYMIAQRALTGKIEALAGCGRMNLKKGDYDRAIHFFGKALGVQPQNAALLLGLAHAYEMKKDFESAISIYEKAVERVSDDRDLYYAMARAYSKKGEHIEAVTLLKKGISRVDNPAKLYMALGHEYRITSQLSDAIDAYKKAAKKGKEAGVEAYRYIGNIYYGQLKHKKKAQKYYKKYVKKDGRKALQVRRILKRM
jgi:tetratricopeptide (TPR) repeat protein